MYAWQRGVLLFKVMTMLKIKIYIYLLFFSVTSFFSIHRLSDVVIKVTGLNDEMLNDDNLKNHNSNRLPSSDQNHK